MPDTLIKVDLTKSAYENDKVHNRWHPDIPMVEWVNPGDDFIIETYDWTGGFIKNNDSADDVRDIDLHTVDWNMRYHRNNRTYRMLMAVCWLVVKGLLQTQSDGTTRMMDFFDEQRMSRLYEKFILEYYRREHPQLRASASFIEWALDDEASEGLPAMRTDITLSARGRVLIIDDVISAGTSVRESIQMIEAAGATPCGVAIALDRQEKATEGGVDSTESAVQQVQQRYGLPVVAVAGLADLLAYLADAPELAAHRPAVLAYRERYGV